MITISNVIHEQILGHGVASYPEECCGLLLGLNDGDSRFVKEFKPLQNATEDSRSNRYVIEPLDLLRTENYVRERGWEILGVFHSHPDHPSRPSEFDRERAILHYSYIILSVADGLAGQLTSWTLHDWDSSFDAEMLLISG